MNSEIKFENLNNVLSEPDNGAVSKDVLVGEIGGLETKLHSIPIGVVLQTDISDDFGRVYIFTSGEGVVSDGIKTFDINEISLFVPKHNTQLHIKSTTSQLTFIELIIKLSSEDKKVFLQSTVKFPVFSLYSECKTYKEKIKSEKTVSKMLLAEYIFPRLCIGSVETTGDDHVSAHEHPMLEQLFFGLKDNSCIVKADSAEIKFEEGNLIHIPLGSNHSVDVVAPNKLHYVWIDLFRDMKDLEYITQEHILDE